MSSGMSWNDPKPNHPLVAFCKGISHCSIRREHRCSQGHFRTMLNSVGQRGCSFGSLKVDLHTLGKRAPFIMGRVLVSLQRTFAQMPRVTQSHMGNRDQDGVYAAIMPLVHRPTLNLELLFVYSNLRNTNISWGGTASGEGGGGSGAGLTLNLRSRKIRLALPLLVPPPRSKSQSNLPHLLFGLWKLIYPLSAHLLIPESQTRADHVRRWIVPPKMMRGSPLKRVAPQNSVTRDFCFPIPCCEPALRRPRVEPGVHGGQNSQPARRHLVYTLTWNQKGDTRKIVSSKN